MAKKILYYFKFIKFGHTIFALPFALIGFFLAYQQSGSSYLVFVYILMCMVFARSAAMGFNRYLDRKIDASNPRTANREIPKGYISPKNALLFVIISSVLFITTTWLINKLVFMLSFVALFIILFYSYTKRFTALCHLILGIGLSLAPIGAYISITAKFNVVPILFSVIVFLWVSGFDIIYSLQDYEFDKSNNLNSIPVIFGKRKALLLSSILHLLIVVPLILLVFLYNFHFLFFIGTVIFVLLLIYQHIIVKPDDLSKINLAFATTNGIASVIFAFFVILDIVLYL